MASIWPYMASIYTVTFDEDFGIVNMQWEFLEEDSQTEVCVQTLQTRALRAPYALVSRFGGCQNLMSYEVISCALAAISLLSVGC